MYNYFMARRIRLIFAVILLSLSLTLLLWGIWPEQRVQRTQPIQPFQMQLPTPVSFEWSEGVMVYLA
jgi:hypothetical protein